MLSYFTDWTTDPSWVGDTRISLVLELTATLTLCCVWGDLFVVGGGWPVCCLGVTLRCSPWVRWHSNRGDTVTQCNLPWGRCIDLWIIYALLTLKQLYWIIDVCLCVPIIITVCRDLNNQRPQKTCGISLMESCLFSNNWLTEWSFTDTVI